MKPVEIHTGMYFLEDFSHILIKIENLNEKRSKCVQFSGLSITNVSSENLKRQNHAEVLIDSWHLKVSSLSYSDVQVYSSCEAQPHIGSIPNCVCSMTKHNQIFRHSDKQSPGSDTLLICN